ncbi:MFS transporter [Caballeronia sp. SEWSISQ10-4 2]|uniref:MFS transporter n=1 Tax=Caballeronia sp. SEWSISQ10-4 2 TaxID=2937438 RepID=UPI0026545AEB|nr:MFS transporter [Caballeronia sp. SEWSISQ10-4 2]MDN7177098.1 MFS transporter [Caballeronia sp. SEWSISQ10-4 2]
MPNPSEQSAARAGAQVAPRYRWVVLGIAWLAMFMTFVDRLAWANVAASASTSLHLPVAALGGFVTAFYVGYVAANAATGIITDRVGPRITLPCALLALGILTYCFSMTTSVAAGVVIQCLMGLAAGVDYAAVVKLIASWFAVRQRARAVGIVFTSISVAVIATNTGIPVELLHTSWVAIYKVLGVTTAASSLACFVFLRNSPESAGAFRGNRIPVRSFVLLLRDKNYWLTTLAGFGACWGGLGFMFWTNALMQKGLGFSPVQSGLVGTVFGIASVVGSPLIGILSDWLGRPRKWITSAVILTIAASLLVFGRLTALVPMQMVAAILGIAAFGWGALVATIITEIVGIELAGGAIGLSNAAQQLGGVLMPLAVGMVFQSTGSFHLAFVTLAAGPLLGGIAVLALREGPLAVNLEAGVQPIEETPQTSAQAGASN